MLKVHVHTTKLFWPATRHHGLDTSVGRRCVDADDVHTLPYACAVLLIGGLVHFYRFTDSWSLASSLRVGHRLATLVDSMRESILALRCNFWCLQGAQSWPR